MVLATHLIVGAAIGSNFRNVWLVAILGLLGHYLLDAIAHHDYSIEQLSQKGIKSSGRDVVKIFIDFSFGFVLGIYLGRMNPYPYFVLLGMFFTVLPDGLILFYYLFWRWLKKSSTLCFTPHLWLKVRGFISEVLLKFLILQKKFHARLHCPKSKRTPMGIETPLWQGIASQALIILMAILFILN